MTVTTILVILLLGLDICASRGCCIMKAGVGAVFAAAEDAIANFLNMG